MSMLKSPYRRFICQIPREFSLYKTKTDTKCSGKAERSQQSIIYHLPMVIDTSGAACYNFHGL